MQTSFDGQDPKRALHLGPNQRHAVNFLRSKVEGSRPVEVGRMIHRLRGYCYPHARWMGVHCKRGFTCHRAARDGYNALASLREQGLARRESRAQYVPIIPKEEW